MTKEQLTTQALQFVKDSVVLIGQYVFWPALVGIGLGLLGYFKYFVDRIKNRHSVKFNGNKSIETRDKLAELRVLCNADRAFLTMFHNGDRYIDGSPLIKSSRVSEVCGPGITHEAQNSQGIILSLYPEIVSTLIDKPLQTHEPSDFNGTSLETRLLSQGIKFFIRVPIKKNRDLVGFVGLDFVLNEQKPIVDFNQISEYSNSIAGIATL